MSKLILGFTASGYPAWVRRALDAFHKAAHESPGSPKKNTILAGYIGVDHPRRKAGSSIDDFVVVCPDDPVILRRAAAVFEKLAQTIEREEIASKKVTQLRPTSRAGNA